jgi:type III restriction enzyme
MFGSVFGEKVKSISPSDYNKFFSALKNQNLNGFKSQFEENLIRYTQSRKVISEKQAEKSKEDQELLELFEDELSRAIRNLEDKKLENDILKIDLQNAEATIGSMKEALTYQPKPVIRKEKKNIKFPVPFNICILGEVCDEDLIRENLKNYFAKYGLKATDWDIVFYSNTKIRNSDVLSRLKKGKTRFNVIITGQIYHHSGHGNQSANLLTELKKDKYIDHIIGCSPEELLTVDNILEKLEEYFSKRAYA